MPKYVAVINKQVNGRRVRKRKTFDTASEKKRWLVEQEAKLSRIYRADEYGDRPPHTVKVLAAEYIKRKAHKKSIKDDVYHPDSLVKVLGDRVSQKIHQEDVEEWATERLKSCSLKTVNLGIQVLRHMLNCGTIWRDDNKVSFLAYAPRVVLIAPREAELMGGKKVEEVPSYPLSWEEQTRLLSALPAVESEACLFAINTGLRDQGVCGLRWEWERVIPELGESVFVITANKNGLTFYLVLNSTARAIIEARRKVCNGPYVFHREGERLYSLNGRNYQKAWREAGLPTEGVKHGVHNLRHTFTTRLRAAGVDNWTIDDLTHHVPKQSDMSRRYAAPSLLKMLEAVNLITAPVRLGMAKKWQLSERQAG